MFQRKSEDGYRTVLDGIDLKTLAHGERTLLAEFRLAAGAVLPVHRHPHEQTGYLVSGRMRLTVADETFEAGPGDAWNIPSDADHGGRGARRLRGRGGLFAGAGGLSGLTQVIRSRFRASAFSLG